MYIMADFELTWNSQQNNGKIKFKIGRNSKYMYGKISKNGKIHIAKCEHFSIPLRHPLAFLLR